MEDKVKWKKEFLDFMAPYRDVEDVDFIVYAGESVESIAMAIMQYLKETPIDFHMIWKDIKEYEKYEALNAYVDKLSEPYNIFEKGDGTIYKLFD